MQFSSTSAPRIRVGRAFAANRQAPALPFAEACSAAVVSQALADERPENALDDGPFSIQVTLFAFLSQVIDDDQSCAAAVARINADRLAQGLPACSPHTSSYCKARERLPLAALVSLSRQCASSLEQEVPATWLWHGRHVKVADGTMVTAPDSPKNREAYPQHHAAKPGLGFPTIRLVALTSLATGAIVEAETGPSRGKGQGELSLAHRLLRAVAPKDIVLGDRLYPGFPFVAAVLARGSDFVARLPRRIAQDLRRGVRQGPGDQLVWWKKPLQCIGLAKDEFAALPQKILVRIVRVTVGAPGAKKRRLTLVTTLTSAETFPKESLAELYFHRWHVELDLRSIKQVIHMDQLRCQTPEMLLKEIWAHLLAYNLVRKTMAAASVESRVVPRQLSFKRAVQTLRAYRVAMVLASRATRRGWQVAILLAVAQCRVGDRPGRAEPRQIKRYPKKYDMLAKPRRGRGHAAG